MADTWRNTARRRYGTLGYLVLAFTVLVILGGAVVRATGSGDGCGASWPRCGGALFPASPGVETVIEFTHRVMTATAIVGVVALVVLAFVLWPKGHIVRTAASTAGVLFVVESLLGASLVLFGWVDQDISIGRLIVVPLHLTNTFLLLGALALTAWWGSGRPSPASERPPGWGKLVSGAVTIVIIGAAGALNALADTVVPSDSLSASAKAQLAGTARFLVDVRIAHPLIAIVGGIVVAWIVFGYATHPEPETRRIVLWIGGLLLTQMFVGMTNIVLLTPLEVQVLHLAIADAIWILYVLLAASVIGATTDADRLVEAGT